MTVIDLVKLVIDVVRFPSPWAIIYQCVSIIGPKAGCKDSLTNPLVAMFVMLKVETETCRVAEAVVTLRMPVTMTFSPWAKAPAKPKATTAAAASAVLKNFMVTREEVSGEGVL